jgi:hypothetical protein
MIPDLARAAGRDLEQKRFRAKLDFVAEEILAEN